MEGDTNLILMLIGSIRVLILFVAFNLAQHLSSTRNRPVNNTKMKIVIKTFDFLLSLCGY